MKRLRLPGGDLEYAVLAKLWEIGTASAQHIHGQVDERAGLVYTTTAKYLGANMSANLPSCPPPQWSLAALMLVWRPANNFLSAVGSESQFFRAKAADKPSKIVKLFAGRHTSRLLLQPRYRGRRPL
jgi:hypothetical protein